MKEKLKRAIASIMMVVMVTCALPITSFAADQLPDAGTAGSGDGGSWSNRGFFMKADFYKPSSYGFTSDKNSWKYKKNSKGKNMDEINMNWESLDLRVLFEKAVDERNGGMPIPKYSAGGADSAALTQLYMTGRRSTWTPVRFLEDRNLWSSGTGHRSIGTGNVQGITRRQYSNNGHLISATNPVVLDLMKMTSNGSVWDTGNMPQYIQTIWNKYANPNSNTYDYNASLMLRKDVVAMFYDENDWADATTKWSNLFNNTIKNGATFNGVKIANDSHAANIKQFYLVSLACVIANPAHGLNVGGTVGKDSYKGGTKLLDNLKSWAASGGNSDVNDKGFHFAIKIEMYGEKTDSNSSVCKARRWDISQYTSTSGGKKTMFSVPARTALGRENMDNPGYYGFSSKLTESNKLAFYEASVQSVKEMNKRCNINIQRMGGRENLDNWGIWQYPILHTDGSTWSTNGYHWRYNCIFNSPGYYKGQRTINAGFTYLSPSGPNPGAFGINPPSWKMNGRAFSDNQEVPKFQKGEATVHINFMWPNPLSADTIQDQKISISPDTWYNRMDELRSMLQLIHRIQVGDQIATGTEFTNLPVTITIRRNFENGGINSDGKILDNLMFSSTQVQRCGKHHFQVISDDGNTAVIRFNIIPDGGQCDVPAYGPFESRVKNANGITGEAALTYVSNCVVRTLFEDMSSQIKFKDSNIEISNTAGSVTKVNYDISYTVGVPTFKENQQAYGDANSDKMRNGGIKTGKGYSVLPNGAAYPNSDYKASGGKFILSDVIRRSVLFTRIPEVPYYSNFGYDEKTPHYAEIKTGRPTFEPFEAMAGTPTTRDLYFSVSGTDFRVDFKANKDAKLNPETMRTYTYIVEVPACTGNNGPCTGCCASCPGGEGHECKHTPHCADHPDPHTWIYKVNIPIEAFSYFDMETSELWRLTGWGLRGGEEFLSKPNPEHDMDTQCWAFNGLDYSSGSGRIIFDASAKGATEGDKAPFGDNTVVIRIDGSSGHEAAKIAACEAVNAAKNSEDPVSGSIISDYIVLKTSEGYQSPYFYSQPFVNSVSIKDEIPDFNNVEGGSVSTTTKLKVEKVLNMDDFWYKNTDKHTCAFSGNGWHNTSITYGGYNGDYSDLDAKYVNDDHDDYLNNKNPLEELLKKENWDIDKFYPNQVRDGSGKVKFGKDKGNKEHIITGLDVIDETPNGEYDSGKAWVRYDRVMMYDGNTDRGAKSSYQGKFESTGNGVWEDWNVPYFDGADEINDIVIHDPVSAEYAIVVSNPPEYDLRTNADLMEGGDPPGLQGGVCPTVGCQFSTLICNVPLTPHTEKCYEMAPDSKIHVGGNNTHTHTDECNHVHSSECYVYSDYCDYNPCICSHCRDPHCDNYCSSHRYKCGGYRLICTKPVNYCSNELNTHTCTSQCEYSLAKTLVCSNPHHYVPGESTDQDNPLYHYPLGDPRCWERCGDNSKHGSKEEVSLPNGGKASIGGAFINLDREFSIYYPFKGDFAEDPSLEGIDETTEIRGKGYVNDMDTREWTDHRWVKFPVNVIDPKGNMRVAHTQIDLNEFSEDDEVFTFYSVLGNNEQAQAQTKFTTTAINAPVEDRDDYFDESIDETNKDRFNDKYAAVHTAHKFHYIDVVGYIGSLAINDTGDFRFSNLFKKAKEDGTYLIPNLVPKVHLNIPNYIVGDNTTVRRDPSTRDTRWLDTYGKMFNEEGGKSGGTDYAKQPLAFPLVPRYNNIPSLRNQPMRPGYQLYMDIETVGNYYGETLDDNDNFIDSKMVDKMQIRPKYYSLNMKTGVYTPVDAYYGVNNEYMMVNDYDYGNVNEDSPGVQDYYYYLDWLNESARRNYTNAEKETTYKAKEFRDALKYSGTPNKMRIPDAERDVIGSANVLFLNDKNRTFIGSPYTYGQYKNPGEKVDERWFNAQSQRWHFTLGLPSSVVFVESNKPCTEANIKALQSKDRVIVSTIDIKVRGEVWTLQYDGSRVNSSGFQVFEGGPIFNPPNFEGTGDSTKDDPIIVVYPSDKTSKDDVISGGIQ